MTLALVAIVCLGVGFVAGAAFVLWFFKPLRQTQRAMREAVEHKE